MEAIKRKFDLKDKNFARLLMILAIVFVLCSMLKPSLFLKSSNFISMAKQFPEFGILAIGISMTMLTGGIDLSAVYVANLSAICAAKFMMAMAPKGTPAGQTIPIIFVGILIALAVGCVCGLINGALVAKFGIPAILATLGTQQLFCGLAIVITEGRSLSGLPTLYSKYGTKTLFGFLPVPLIIFLLCACATGFLLAKTSFGSKLYLLGTNPTASRFAGLNNDKLLIGTYGCAGTLSAAAGMLMMASSNSTRADYGSSYTMQCILIAVMGGISPSGGVGNIKGVVVAVVILQMLSSALNMFENVSNFYRDIIWGLALIAVLIFNYVINDRESKKSS